MKPLRRAALAATAACLFSITVGNAWIAPLLLADERIDIRVVAIIHWACLALLWSHWARLCKEQDRVSPPAAAVRTETCPLQLVSPGSIPGRGFTPNGSRYG